MTFDYIPYIPKVSVVILNWNGLQDTLACLESVLLMDYRSFDVMVVDNGSTDGSVEALTQKYGSHSRIEILKNESNLGFSEGNNIGIRRALEKESDYVLLLNNDTKVDKEMLKDLIRTVQGDEKIGLAGPKVYFQESPGRLYSSFDRVNLWLMAALPTTRGRMDRGQYDHLREADNLVGCALLANTKAVRRVGMLDPEYFAYYEEVDWSYRMRKSGYKVVFVPQAIAYHKGEASLKRRDPSRITYYKMRNLILFMRKHAHWGQWIGFLGVILPAVWLLRFARALVSLDFKAAGSLIRAVAYHLKVRKPTQQTQGGD